MRRFAPLALVLAALLQAAVLARAHPDVFTDDSFSSPGRLDGTEVVGGNVLLRIVPENWVQTTKTDFELWTNDENVRAVDPGNVMLAHMGDNWIALENIDDVGGFEGKATIGAEDVQSGEQYIFVLWRDGAVTDKFRRYRISTGDWDVLRSPSDTGLALVRNGVAMAWDNGNYIYAIMGSIYTKSVTDTENLRTTFLRYNISENYWENLDNTPHYQGPGGALAWVKLGDNEYIYAVLGTTSSLAKNPDQRKMLLARYNISTGRWENLYWKSGYKVSGWTGWKPYGCDDGSNLVWTGGDSLYYLVGAYNEGLTGPEESRFLRYSITDNEWTELAPIPYNGAPADKSGVDDGGSLAWLGGDYIYALKGGDGGGGIYTDNFYRFDIRTNVWGKLGGVPEKVGKFNGNRLGVAGRELYYWRGYPSTGFWKYDPPEYSVSGEFTSGVFDAGVDSVWRTISWDDSSPAGSLNKKRLVGAEPVNSVSGENRIGLLPTWKIATHVVISEFATRGPDNAYQEFVELYNPTSSGVSVEGWRIQYRSATGARWYTRVTFPSGATIPANGFYLAVNRHGYPDGSIGGMRADAPYTDTLGIADSGHIRLLNAAGQIIDAVSYGTGHNHTGGPPAPNHGTAANSRSVERKARPTSTPTDMGPGGADENAGNGCDTGNDANDFVVRTTRQPQSSGSPTESPPPPTYLTTYMDTRRRDRVYENIGENNLGVSRVWSQDNWSGENGQLVWDPSRPTRYYSGENISAADDIRLKIGWESRAAWPGTVGPTVACYAENGGRKYIYALESEASPFLYRYDIAANVWENLRTSYPQTTAAGSGMVWTRDNYLYITRGGTATTFNFYRYNLVDNTWTPLAATGTAQLSGSGLAWDGGDNIYAAIRSTAPADNTLKVYSISAGTWTTLIALPATADSGSSIVRVGGFIYYQRGGTTSYWRYSVADNTWASLAPMPLSSGPGGAQEKVSDDFIFAVRGGTSTSFYRYSIPDNTWTTMDALPGTVTNANDRLTFDGTHLYLVRGSTDNCFWRYSMFTRGGLLSSVYDAADVASWGALTFDGYSAEPENVSVVVKVRTGTDDNPCDGAENWSGWQEFEKNIDLPHENRYLQYMVELRSSKPGLTPVFDNLKIYLSEYEYALLWEHRITGVENTYENSKLRIRGKTSGDNENIVIAIWDDLNNRWENIDDLTTTEKEITFTIDNILRYLRGDSICIKYESADNTDATRTTIHIDYVVLEAQKPYSTSVRVWTSSSSDNSTWSDWIERASGDSLPYENRYIRYRVRLSTTDGEVTPALRELRIAYVTKTPRSGTFTGQPLKLGYVDGWGTLSWDAELPVGTSITFATRSSPDGSNWSEWEELVSGAIKSPTYGRPYLQVRATLRGTGVTSPTLRSYTVSHTPDRTPPGITLSEPSDGFVTGQSYITLRGEVRDSNPLILKVNGEAVLFTSGNFSTRVWLSPGMNTISLTARDVAGNERTLTIRGILAAPLPVTPSGPSAEQVAVVAAVAAGAAALVAAWASLGGLRHRSSGGSKNSGGSGRKSSRRGHR